MDRATGRQRRGSGYRVSLDRVLTAAHVLDGATRIRVRCDSDQPGQWEADADLLWSRPEADLAVLAFPVPPGAPGAGPARFGRLRDARAVVDVVAAGFPRWKRREMRTGRGVFRDLHDAVGAVAVLSNRRTGTLEITVTPPAPDPDGHASPWEMMSGAAVWAGSHIIGVVAEHHHREGLGRLTAIRLDRWFDQPDATGTVLAQALGVGEGTILHDVVPRPPEWWRRLGYLDQVRAVAPAGGLRGREAERAALADFCSGDETYLWWQAGPWAGKTALLASFALAPPVGVEVVSFFVTAGITARADSDAFTDAVTDQLSAIIGETSPQGLGPATRDAHRRSLMSRAITETAAAGKCLILVVDGLDEDNGARPGSGMPSIASLLPKQSDPGLKVIVASRPDPPLPADVPAGHPLRQCRVVELPPSPAAVPIEQHARRELSELLADSGAGAPHTATQDLLGLIVASGGGLTTDDLAALTSVPSHRLDHLLQGSLGRTIGRRFGDVLVFTHQTLRETAGRMLDASLPELRRRIHGWADEYRRRGWPPSSPAYLVRDYPVMLREAGEAGMLAVLATDPDRAAFLLGRTGGDAQHLSDIDLAQQALLRQPEPDLGALAALSVRRGEIAHAYAKLPPSLPATLARLGHVGRAESVALSMTDPGERAKALYLFAKELVNGGNPQLAQDVIDHIAAISAVDLSPVDRAAVNVRTAAIRAAIGRLDAARELIRAFAIPDEAGTDAIVDSYGDLAQAVAPGDPRLARECIDIIVKSALEHDNPLIAVKYLRIAGRAAASAADIERVTAIAEHIEARARTPRASTWTAEFLARAAEVHAAAGDTRRAVELAVASASALPQVRNPQEAVAASIALSDVAIALRRPEIGYRHLDNAFEIASTLQGGSQPQEQRNVLQQMIRALAAAGSVQAAEEVARSLYEEEVVVGLVDLADLVSRQGPAADALTLVEAALKVNESLADHPQSAAELIDLAQALAAAGDSEFARAVLADAEEVIAAIAGPYAPAEELGGLAMAAYAIGDTGKAKKALLRIAHGGDYLMADPLYGATGVVVDIGGLFRHRLLRVLTKHAGEQYLVEVVDEDGRRSRFRRAARLARSINDPAVRATALSRLALQAFQVGRTGLGRRLTAEAYRTPVERADCDCDLLIPLARSLAAAGRSGEASQLVMGWTQSTVDRGAVIWWDTPCLAVACAHVYEDDRATHLARLPTFSILDKQPGTKTDDRIIALASIAEVAFSRPDTGPARRWLADAESLASRTVASAAAQYAIAEAHAAAGDLNRAALLAPTIGDPRLQARIYVRLAEEARAAGDAAGGLRLLAHALAAGPWTEAADLLANVDPQALRTVASRYLRQSP